MSGAWPT